MKLNYSEVVRLPYHLQLAICHNSDNESLQKAFPQCFTGEEGSHQIPWSYINMEGHIGKDCYEAEGYEFGITSYLDTIKVPYVGICDYSSQSHQTAEQNHLIWSIPADNGKPFCPTLVIVNGQLLLIVSVIAGSYMAYGIPASIIDFSK